MCCVRCGSGRACAVTGRLARDKPALQLFPHTFRTPLCRTSCTSTACRTSRLWPWASLPAHPSLSRWVQGMARKARDTYAAPPTGLLPAQANTTAAAAPSPCAAAQGVLRRQLWRHHQNGWRHLGCVHLGLASGHAGWSVISPRCSPHSGVAQQLPAAVESFLWA